MSRHFLALLDFKKEEIEGLLHRALLLKKGQKAGKGFAPLRNKNLILLFEKSSTRTRVSFEVAILQLGGHSLYMTSQTSQVERGETYEDTGRVLSRYVDGIVMRTFEQKRIERLASQASVPVINGLSDLLHPCQVLADLLTCLENKKPLHQMKVAWVGDGNNVANSWIEAASLFGFPLKLACPKGFDPLQKRGFKNIELTRDPFDACLDADVINTDTWVSMGQEGKGEGEKNNIAEKKRLFKSYQVNEALLKKAKPDCIVLHCLPAHRGEEITDEVMDGPRSRVWDQAENRLHVQKALLEKLMGSVA